MVIHVCIVRRKTKNGLRFAMRWKDGEVFRCESLKTSDEESALALAGKKFDELNGIESNDKGLWKRGSVYYARFRHNSRSVRVRLSADLETARKMLARLRTKLDLSEFSNRIRVTLLRRTGRPLLYMQYRDPETGRKVMKSTGTATRREAMRAAAKWERSLSPKDQRVMVTKYGDRRHLLLSYKGHDGKRKTWSSRTADANEAFELAEKCQHMLATGETHKRISAYIKKSMRCKTNCVSRFSMDKNPRVNRALTRNGWSLFYVCPKILKMVWMDTGLADPQLADRVAECWQFELNGHSAQSAYELAKMLRKEERHRIRRAGALQQFNKRSTKFVEHFQNSN